MFMATIATLSDSLSPAGATRTKHYVRLFVCSQLHCPSLLMHDPAGFFFLYLWICIRSKFGLEQHTENTKILVSELFFLLFSNFKPQNIEYGLIWNSELKRKSKIKRVCRTNWKLKREIHFVGLKDEFLVFLHSYPPIGFSCHYRGSILHTREWSSEKLAMINFDQCQQLTYRLKID